MGRSDSSIKAKSLKSKGPEDTVKSNLHEIANKFLINPPQFDDDHAPSKESSKTLDSQGSRERKRSKSTVAKSTADINKETLVITPVALSTPTSTKRKHERIIRKNSKKSKFSLDSDSRSTGTSDIYHDLNPSHQMETGNPSCANRSMENQSSECQYDLSSESNFGPEAQDSEALPALRVEKYFPIKNSTLSKRATKEEIDYFFDISDEREPILKNYATCSIEEWALEGQRISRKQIYLTERALYAKNKFSQKFDAIADTINKYANYLEQHDDILKEKSEKIASFGDKLNSII
ncbi:hypothetical protein DASC09_035550 [Saccharomycopsis crataegensis]|uniref:Extracellular mutant protein 11 C-terminal domain-containing protein n=1 Tax=Saccharomycopsis crataegensis TaxID=43959 RepID=A0AAV5QPI0_9ASCO|nr:hypothetical protein DASC09_035550 [Saccharomycopsis crataegensis]